jgi:hypothetical protein
MHERLNLSHLILIKLFVLFTKEHTLTISRSFIFLLEVFVKCVVDVLDESLVLQLNVTLERDWQVSLLQLLHQRVERNQLGEQIAVNVIIFLFVFDDIEVKFFDFKKVFASLLNELLELWIV